MWFGEPGRGTLLFIYCFYCHLLILNSGSSLSNISIILIHMEANKNKLCANGILLTVENDSVSLQESNPDGRLSGPVEYKFS